MLATSAKTCPLLTTVPTPSPGLGHTCQYCVRTMPFAVEWRMGTPGDWLLKFHQALAGGHDDRLQL